MPWSSRPSAARAGANAERDGGTRDGGEGVGDEGGQGAPAVFPVQGGYGLGVEAVGEVVAEHGDRHHGPDGAAGLEPAPMATPSNRLCPTSADAATMPRPGAWRGPAYSPCSPSWPRWIAPEAPPMGNL